jgi:hypothetical protein
VSAVTQADERSAQFDALLVMAARHRRCVSVEGQPYLAEASLRLAG